jgi:hypothetical protein
MLCQVLDQKLTFDQVAPQRNYRPVSLAEERERSRIARKLDE